MEGETEQQKPEQKPLDYGDVIIPKEQEIQDWLKSHSEKMNALRLGIAEAMLMEYEQSHRMWDFINGKYPQLERYEYSLCFDKKKNEHYIMVTGKANK